MTTRLKSFASSGWQCKAMYQLSFSDYCPTKAFCKSTDEKVAPTMVRGGTDWDRLALAEVYMTSSREPFYA